MARPGAGRRTPQSRGAQRPSSRPPAPRQRSRTSVGPAERRRPRLTGRAAVLAVVFAVLVVSYASSMRAWLDQRATVADAEARIAAAETEIASLERERKRWRDDAYVEAQGRSVLGWVMPGETSYQVIDRDGEPLAAERTLPEADDVVPENDTPWWRATLDSLRIADHPELEPEPAERIAPPPTTKKSQNDR